MVNKKTPTLINRTKLKKAQSSNDLRQGYSEFHAAINYLSKEMNSFFEQASMDAISGLKDKISNTYPDIDNSQNSIIAIQVIQGLSELDDASIKGLLDDLGIVQSKNDDSEIKNNTSDE
ncbi:hypothetical protein [Apilactobacillus timberlakei]|uniref:hypothetical protein n=1 Tax=Apilactobacillus timberlakei TaxID=2008380 RepID=UPI001129B184|nr:hypothetical protein [Apilactobacillus timberlakei]TPR16725.1 hypothetical protein DYZ95_07025 [Apilactobacillus timberlakei]